MPELPEVENVVRNLKEILPSGSRLTDWEFFSPKLRYIIPRSLLRSVIGQKLIEIKRRAKYIIFEFESCFVISHLGMTGAWRNESGNKLRRKHDHLAFSTSAGVRMVYEDPRRFGFIKAVKKNKIQKEFETLGPEPLEDSTDFEILTRKFKKLKGPIKTALMNQKNLVGVGNIYASEILFSAKVKPTRSAAKINVSEYEQIWFWTRKILSKAIERGGSTIDDYRNVYGESGGFQNEFLVYGREGEKCMVCKTPIKEKVMAGRSTFWCSTCQS